MNKRQKKKQITMYHKKAYKVYKRHHSTLRKLLKEESYRMLIEEEKIRSKHIWGGTINPYKRHTNYILGGRKYV